MRRPDDKKEDSRDAAYRGGTPSESSMSSDPTRTHPRHQQEVNVMTSRGRNEEREEEPTDGRVNERLKDEKNV